MNDFDRCVVYFLTYNVTYIISSILVNMFVIKVFLIYLRLKFLNEQLTKITLNPKQITHLRYKLNKITQIHLDLWYGAKLVNRTYSFQLLILIYKCFTTILDLLNSIIKSHSLSLILIDGFWTMTIFSEMLVIILIARDAIMMVG